MTYHARLITCALFPSDTISFSLKSWKATLHTQPQRAWEDCRRCKNGMGGMTHNFYCLKSATVLHTIKLDVGSRINTPNPDPALQILLQAEENRIFIWDHIWLLCTLLTLCNATKVKITQVLQMVSKCESPPHATPIHCKYYWRTMLHSSKLQKCKITAV